MSSSANGTVIGLGAGGHAQVVLEALQLQGGWALLGLLDRDPALSGTQVRGTPILGTDEALLALAREHRATHFVVGVGSVGDATFRQRLFARGRAAGLRGAVIVHPRAYVAPSATLGEGTVILALAAVNTAAQVGENVIVNTGAIVEHDCVIGDHVHVATGARLAGGVEVGAGAHIGAGATVRQGIRIGAAAVVGAGAVVVKDVPAGAVVVGVPAAELVRKRGNAHG